MYFSPQKAVALLINTVKKALLGVKMGMENSYQLVMQNFLIATVQNLQLMTYEEQLSVHIEVPLMNRRPHLSCQSMEIVTMAYSKQKEMLLRGKIAPQ